MFNPRTPFDPAADVMKHYRLSARDAEFVSLKHYDLTDLVPLMGHLADLKNMKTLIVSDNLLTRLPEDLSSLTYLETLDVARNPFPGASHVIRGLYSLPNLKHLYITLPDEDEDQIVATLQHLRTLNGVPLDVDGRDGNAAGTGDSETAAAQSLLRSVRLDAPVAVPRGYMHPEPSSTLQSAMKSRVWSRDSVAPLLELQGHVKKVSGNLSNPAEFEDLVHLVETHVRSKTRNQPDPLKAGVAQLLGRGLLMEYSLDELVRAAAKFGPDLADALHAVFRAHTQLLSDASTLITALQEDRDRKIGALQEDLAKELLVRERASPPQRTTAATVVRESHTASASEAPLQSRAGGSHPSGSLPDDVMALTELRALLQLFFDSKKKHDAANVSAHLPRETVEQHIYTFLYSRTTTDDEIKKRVAVLFNSIRYHAKHELDVEVFSLILRHEVDEDFWDAFASRKSLLFDTIQSTIAASGPAAMNGFVTEEQATEVVNLLSPPPSAHNDSLMKALRRALTRDESTADRYHIGYSLLGNTLLRHFVSSYFASIRPVVERFRELDTERCGVINVSRFRSLLHALLPGISSARIQELTTLVDPHSNDLVTLSSAIDVLRNVSAQQRSATSRAEPSGRASVASRDTR